MTKLHNTFSALQDAIKSARDVARLEAMKDCGKGFFRSRGVWMVTRSDKKGLVEPLPENFHSIHPPTAARFDRLIAEIAANYPEVDSISFEGGFNFASQMQDFEDGTYAPWVSEWSVVAWRTEDTLTVDAIIRRLTGFESLADMLDSHPSYRPTIATTRAKDELERAELTTIADAYDAGQAARGDARRAYRT